MEVPKTISTEALEEFKAIYQEEFGETLSDDKAEERALRVLRIFDILLKPGPDDS